ncbi:MAG: T9SS type A sorting domain-containing protein [Arachidicoccus sp.]|nr:T9SS type A sorting domain-containing protein [Arachidicoccus sp.]
MHNTPYQLRYWHLLYTPVPEGALAGNVKLEASPDTINAGQDYNFTIAFKNISNQSFRDSIIANVNVNTASNNNYTIAIPNLKKLQPGDTSIIHVTIPGDTSIYNESVKNPLLKAAVPTTSLTGINNLSIYVNPNFAQPEETLENNQLFKSFYVKSSTANTNLDVTFDGVHILNNDIVAAKPDILIHLISNSKYILLTDTSSARISLKYPDGTIKAFSYTNDTLIFIPAKDSSNNEAIVDFKPYLTQDGTYELIVNGQAKNGTSNVATSYSVAFQVYNKPMISDMFNYPNPFTSSTAFVFTITGSEVPQNIRIEILTVTGKIVKEITRAELGNLHVGRNITDYKWDGTDMYGQKLANGVYLYRVITNENGKSLDKFNVTDQYGNSVNTGKYFNKGYGKMYLMR